MKKNLMKLFVALVAVMACAMLIPVLASAETAEAAANVVTDNTLSAKAWAAAIAVGVAATAGAIGMGWAIVKSVDSIARQPEAEGKIRTTLMLGLVFVETAIIYALVIAILIIFVL